MCARLDAGARARDTRAMAKPHSPRQLAALIDRLAPALRRLAGTGEAGATRVAALARLDREGPATMRELAAALGVSPQAVTGTVDALEADGLVMRERHPTDRRKVTIRLAEHATDRARAAQSDRSDALGALFDGIAKEDRAAFARVAEALLERIEARGR
jgi:DNA-binding MarR family transcriptional regulator